MYHVQEETLMYSESPIIAFGEIYFGDLHTVRNKFRLLLMQGFLLYDSEESHVMLQVAHKLVQHNKAQQVSQQVSQLVSY